MTATLLKSITLKMLPNMLHKGNVRGVRSSKRWFFCFCQALPGYPTTLHNYNLYYGTGDRIHPKRRRTSVNCFLSLITLLVILIRGMVSQSSIERSELRRLRDRLDNACPILFSVVVTSCSERVHVLDRCLTSIVRQGYMALSEIIVVHDACQHVESLQQYSERLVKRRIPVNWIPDEGSDKFTASSQCTVGKVQFVRHVTNRGLSASRNTGVKLARGVFVWPIDADDFLARRLLSTLTKQLHRDKIDILGKSQVNVIVPGMGDHKGRLNNWQPKRLQGVDILLENPFHCCSMIRREMFHFVSYNEALIYGWEDWDLWINMHKKIGIKEYILPGPWYVYTATSAKPSMSRFCIEHQNVCRAFLHFANSEYYEDATLLQDREELLAAGSILWKSHLWTNIVNMRNQSPLTEILVKVAPDYLNAKYRREYKDLGNLARLARTYQTSIRDYGELMRLVQSARAGGLSPFHQIVSKCPKLSQLKSLITHSATSILNVDSGSFIILHIFKRTQDCGLLELNNVFFPRRIYTSVIDMDSLAAVSESEDILDLLSAKSVKRGPYYYSHVTDYLRFAVLFSFGGTYIDTDMVLMQNPQGIYNMGMESEAFANGAFLSFEVGHNFLRQCLREFRTAYNENTWGCVGPMLLTDILNRSSELKVARPVAFYKVHWSKQKQMFRDPMTEAEFHDPEVYGYHFWSKMWGSASKIQPQSLADHAFKFSCTNTCHQKCLH